jgi:hypothetical protein
MGPVPKQLRPIFRDRHDFDAGGTLPQQTVAALDDAAALILLASPSSAVSRPVNAEEALFRERHPERPLIPLILDGEPGAILKSMATCAMSCCVAPRRRRSTRRRLRGCALISIWPAMVPIAAGRCFRHCGTMASTTRTAGTWTPDAIDRVVRKYAAALGLDCGYSARSMPTTFTVTRARPSCMIGGDTTQIRPRAFSDVLTLSMNAAHNPSER